MKKSSTKKQVKSKSKVKSKFQVPSIYKYKFRKLKRKLVDIYREYILGTYPTTDLWNLDETISNFLVPRLKEFKSMLIGYPANLKSAKGWEKVLTEIIWLFEVYHRDWLLGFEPTHLKKEDHDRAKKAWALFQKHFNNLWN